MLKHHLMKGFNFIMFVILISFVAIGCGGSSGGDDDGNGDTNTYYRDSDGDGYGDPNNTQETASQPAGYVLNGTDCDDTNAAINPGAIEVCDDGVDNDCDEDIDGADSDCGASVTSINGTAAAGAPIVGMVNAKGANGGSASSNIELDGSYSINVTALTAPYIIYAEGTVNGKTIRIYSAGVSAGTINISPVTDLILRNAMGQETDTSYDNWDSNQVDEGDLSSAETDIQAQLFNILSAFNISSTVDLLTTPFAADHTGLDALLDSISISYSGDIATITNNLTGSSYTDNITISADGTGFPSSDETDIQAVLDDAAEIKAVWQSLENLYSTTPANSNVNNWIDNNIADDYLSDGETKTDLQFAWTNNDGPAIGLVLSTIIIKPFDVSNTTYTKGYRIRLYISNVPEPDSGMTIMVYDGTEWLWFGNRRWVETGVNPHAFMYVNSSDQRSFETGFETNLDDDNNYAYDQGARSAIITGPGLPVKGVVYEHVFPEPGFEIFGSGGVFIAIADDGLISTIPNNAEFTYTFCAESADDLYNEVATCTVLQTQTDIVMYPPVLNSELNTSMFASLTNPTTHSASELNFGGNINVSWTIPEGTDSNSGGLTWSNSSVEYEVGLDFEDDSTSATFDTNGLPAPDGWAGLFIRVEDDYGRDFNMGWELF